MKHYDARTIDCLDDAADSWGMQLTAEVKDILRDGAKKALQAWRRNVYGADDDDGDDDPDESYAARSAQRGVGTAGAGHVLDAGQEGPEHPFSRSQGPKLQRALLRLMGDWRLQGLKTASNELTADGGFHFKRLEDLNHDMVDHSWLWGVSPVHGRRPVRTDRDRLCGMWGRGTRWHRRSRVQMLHRRSD